MLHPAHGKAQSMLSKLQMEMQFAPRWNIIALLKRK